MDQSALREPLCRVFGDPAVAVMDWHVQSLSERTTMPTTAGLYRIGGTAASAGQALPWSLILKVVRPPVDQTPRTFPRGWDPTHHCYWKREPMAYQSELLEAVSGDFAAARCFGVVAQADDLVWLWLEDLAADASAWPAEQYARAARHLGAFNGAYLVDRPLPTAPWLNHRCLRTVTALLALLDDPSTWAGPLVRQAFAEPVADRVLRLYAERDLLLSFLERCPRTLCHHDAHRGNLFARRAGSGFDQTVAIDWAQVGTGAIGEDLVQLVLGLFADDRPSVTDAPSVHKDMFASYLEGMCRAGWQGDPRLARFGYLVAATLRGSFSALEMALAPALEPRRHACLEQKFGQAIEDYMAHWAQIEYAFLELADEARRLLPLVEDLPRTPSATSGKRVIA